MANQHRPVATETRLVPLPWDAEILESKDAAIQQGIWRWNIDISYIAHIIWREDEYGYKTLCKRSFDNGYAPIYYADSYAKHCSRCQAVMDKALE